jgi:uncharacterized protein YndB with AHSA1/START domain
VTREVTIAASAASVWRALTDPVELAAWFGAEVELDVRRGGAVRFRWPDGTERRGVVVDLTAPRRLAFRWRTLRTADGGLATTAAAVVTFELEPDGDVTRVAVTEQPGVMAGGEPVVGSEST